jgi:multimeric flavodoxin WrbA
VIIEKELVMRTVALIGSPRKGSNTDTLIDETLRGFKTGGHTSEKVYLYGYEISPCIDCRKCKTGDYNCIINDGMQQIYPKMDAADLIIFGTPNYWYGPTAKMKLLIDRMRPYIANGKLKGKKAVVIIPAAEGPSACGPLIEMFRMSFDYVEMEFTGKILAEAYEKGEIKADHEVLKNAYDLGASI